LNIGHAIEVVGLAVDAAAVAVIVLAIGIAAVAFARGLNRGLPFETSYRSLRQSIGRGILLGLELLVAADIIRTVAIAPTFTSIGVLAGIVLIRTFLSFSLEVELTGRWPWQPPALERPNAPAAVSVSDHAENAGGRD
jgi:uncharacterized membrane protein